VAFSLLAVIALLGWGYFYVVNDSRVQTEVERYLSAATGCKVKVDRAQFSLLSGIRVKNLCLYIGQSELPFLQAQTVVMNHRPSGLILRGRLEPTEIVCLSPVVSLVEDVNTGRLNTDDIFPLPQVSTQPGRLPLDLPVIRIRDGELNVYDSDAGQLVKIGSTRMSVVLRPREDRGLYQLEFDEQGQSGSGISGQGTLDTSTGRTQITGFFALSDLSKTLPRKYRTWYKRYQITGRPRGCEWTMAAHVGATTQSNDPAQFERGAVRLNDVSMELPPEEGGLKLANVRGRLIFDPAGIEVRELTGRLPQLGGAAFSLQGRYDGYDAQSSFDLALKLENITLPISGPPPGRLGDVLAQVQKSLGPAGKAALAANIQRLNGQVHVHGQVDLQDLTLNVGPRPLPVEQVEGQILFDDDCLEFRQIRARAGVGTLEAKGTLSGWGEQTACDLTISAKDMELTRQLHDALPPTVQAAWDGLDAHGRINCVVAVRRGGTEGEPTDVQAEIDLDGRTSVRHAEFPLPLDKLHGKVKVNADRAVLENVTGISGKATCTINGWAALTANGDYQLRFSADDLALDRQLYQALPQQAREIYQGFNLSGQADVMDGVVTRTGGQTQYLLPVTLEEVTMTPAIFPYRLEHANGNVTISPGKVVIEHLLARHAQARVNLLRGSFDLGERLERLSLQAEVEDLPLDEQLRAALPEGLRADWDAFSPSGITDLSVQLATQLGPSSPAGEGGGAATASSSAPATVPAPAPAAVADYRLVLRPHTMRARHRLVPWPMSELAGTIIVEPAGLTFQKLAGLAGAARFELDGRILTPPDGLTAQLALKSGPLPIDKPLLDLLPARLREQTGISGGTVAANLKSLRIGPGASAATAPASAPATAKASGELEWAMDGRLDLADLVLDPGLGAAVKLSASLDGQLAAAGADRLRAAADLNVSRLDLGERHMGDFTGRIEKDPSSALMKINNIVGNICGGRLAGFAEVKLIWPMPYGFSLSVEDADLERLLGLAATTTQPADVKGKLTGSLQMTAMAGDPTSRIANGKFHIGEGNIYRVPVLLGTLPLLNLYLPGEDSFHTADVDYYLKGTALAFTEVYLQGSGMSLLGAGSVDLKTNRMDMTFLSGKKVPRMSALEEVLQGLTNEIVTIRVTGPANKPQIKNVPLRSLGVALRDLFKGSDQ
jgi:hypothetical protein